jgi:hypothetical protein
VPAPGSPAGGFEIDGNLCTDTAGNLDWDTVGGQPVANDGRSDSTQFTSGASENSWPWSQKQTEGVGTASESADITNVYAFSHVSGGHLFGYLAFERVATTGTIAYRIELNQKPNLFGPVPDRTVGDLRLTITQSGSQTLSLARADRWNGSAWIPLGSLAGFVGQVNQGAVTNLSGTTLPTGSFAELAIDLTTLFGTTCSGNFTTLNLRSESSLSETASLGDWVSPLSFSVPSTCPTVRVDKTWVIDGTSFPDGSQPSGFTAALALTGQNDPQFGVTYTTRSNGMTYATGDVVTVGETVSPLPVGCTNNASGDLGTHTLASGPNAFAITNTVTCTYLTLRKSVVGGSATPDQWTLTATGATTFSTPGNADTRMRVEPGTYTLSETGPGGYRLRSLTCTPVAASGDTVTVASGDDVTCTFTNAALHPVVLTKVWQNAIAGDTVDLTITDGTATGTGTSTAPDTTTDAMLDTLAGDTVQLSEAFTTGDSADYATTLTCDNGAILTDGSFTVPPSLDAGTPITCTFTNARRAATITLQKSWVNGAAEDTAELSINGETVPPGFATAVAPPPNGTGLSPQTASATAFSGDDVDLAEQLTGNTGTYTTNLTCTDSAGLMYTPGDLSGTYTVPVAPSDVTCTFSNARTSATITLQKIWVGGAAGDTAGLTITGSDLATQGSAVATVPPSGNGLSTQTASATIFSGGEVSLVEDLPASGNTNTGSYTTTFVCSTPGLRTGRGQQGGTYRVPPNPVDVTCTFTNTRTTATLILQKSWENGAAGDTTDLSATGEAGTSSATATVPAGGSGLSADRATLTLASGETVNLAETLGASNTGTYTSQIICNQPGLTANGDGTGGTFQVPDTPLAVTCTITNTRTSATLILQKTWVNGAAGDATRLTIVAPAEATFGFAISSATGAPGSETDTTNQASTPIFSGDTVDLAELLERTNTGTYGANLTCTDPMGLTYAPGAHVGAYMVPATPLDVTCTFTNTRTSATLILQKTWVNGAGGDTAGLSVTGGSPAVSASNTSTATGASGSETDTTNQAITTAYSGDAIDLAEAFGANAGTYDADLTCTDAVGLTYASGNLSGAYTVPGTPLDVTCTFTNTRTSATLVLQKAWVDGAVGDTADLDVSGGSPAVSASNTSTATGASGSETDTANQASTTIYSGASLTLAETLGTTNLGSYTSVVSCDQPGLMPTGDGRGGTYAVPDTPVAVTCTITNNRTSATLILQKTWVNGSTGDTADLSVNGATTGAGFATSTASGGTGSETDTANQATAPVLSGESVDLAETLGSTNLGSYTSAISCDQPGLTPDGDGQGGTYTVPATPSAVTCTITNTRTSATLILQKTWVNGAADDHVLLAILGSNPAVSAQSTSTATGAAGSETDTTNQAIATVYSGQGLALFETFAAAVGAYDADLTCTDSAGLNYVPGAHAGVYRVPATPQDVTCTFTNTRTSAAITLQKTWVNGAAGDTADLTIEGGAPSLASATSTATGASGPETDTVNHATATALSGSTITLAEQLGTANTGSYTSHIACDPSVGFTPGVGGQGGTLVVAPEATSVLCTTITNTRTSATLTLQKEWVNGVIGDTANLSIDGATSGPGVATAMVPASGTGLSADKASATLLSGAQVILAETLGSHNAATYTSRIICDRPGLIPNEDGRGGTFAVPATSEPVTCTITNTGPPPAPTVTKSVVSNTQNSNGTWTVGYDLAVTNSAAAGQARYALSDTLAFGSGISVNSAKVTGPPGITVNPNWNGATDTTVVSDGLLGTGETHHYTVTVNATVTNDASPDDRTCAIGGGFMNHAQVGVASSPFAAPLATSRSDPPGQTDSACADPASPTIAKRPVSVARASNGTWNVTYQISVANPSATTSLVYSLSDEPDFPAGVTVNSATVIGARDSTGKPITKLVNTWNGSALSIVSTKHVAAGVTDTYTVLVNTTVAPQAESSAACQAGQSGHGYLNTATATSGSDSFHAQACIALAVAFPAAGTTPPSPPGFTPTPGSTPPLAFTGIPVAQLLTAALALLGIGVLLVLIAIRPRRKRNV